MLLSKNNQKNNENVSLHYIKQVDDIIQSQRKHHVSKQSIDNHHDLAQNNKKQQKVSGQQPPVVKIHSINYKYTKYPHSKQFNSTSSLHHPIKHKTHKVGTLILQKGRLRTLSDKQNELKPFLPSKYNTKMPKRQNTLNVTSRSQSSKILHQISQCFQDRNLKYDSNSTAKPNNTLSVTQLQPNKPIQPLQRSLSNVKSQSQISSMELLLSLSNNFSHFSKRHNKVDVKEQIQEIVKKRQVLQNEKQKLQYTISKLKENIERQRQRAQEIQKENYEMTSRKVIKKESKRQDIDPLKKIQIIFTEVKGLRCQIDKSQTERKIISQKISQEHQLIDNYCFVINEIKNQLKLQNKEKTELGKSLSIIKKQQKVLHLKRMGQEIQNQELLSNVYDSLGKWR